MQNKPLLIVGSGGHARTVYEVAKLNKFKVVGFVDIKYNKKKINKSDDEIDKQVLGGVDILENFDGFIFLAIGDNKIRTSFFKKYLKSKKITNLIHPNALISKKAMLIGHGIFIGSGVILNSYSKLKENCIINSGSIIEHEVNVEENVNICPGVKIGGRTKIGKNSFIGIGSTILDSINLGSDCLVGAGTVVTKSFPSNSKILGVPAKKIVS